MVTFPLLLDPQALWPHLDHPALRILDLGRLSVFRQVHIRGARWVSGKRLMAGGEDGGKMASLATLAVLCTELDVRPDHHIVVYDDEGGAWAGRMIWTLHRLGFARVSLLDGGIHGWLAAGLPTVEGAPMPPATGFSLQPLALHDSSLQISCDALMAALATQQVSVWDCRSVEEYSGEQLAARRGGHIPSALHYEWTQAIDRHNGLRLRPLDQIRQELTERGIICAKPIVTYCQSHHRSGFSYVLGRMLGLSIAAYDGGWQEWGNRRDTPIGLGEQP